LVNILKGAGDAALKFILIGIIVPLAIQYFYVEISNYVTLPSTIEIWAIMIIFGALFAITGFFQNAYLKGEYPWLFGRIGSGLVTIGFISYLLLFLPNVAGAGAIHATGLIALIYLAVGLSYLYLVLDFADARRARKKAQEPAKTEKPVQPENLPPLTN
jgi:hypothetical protein